MDAERRVHTVAATQDLPPPRLDGELRFDRAPRDAAAEDFGHMVHRPPEAVLLPRSASDVSNTIRWAGERGRTFAAQGQRHSVWGRSQARDGIVADMSMLRSIGSVSGDRVVVDAGATWSEVLAVTLPHGKTPPVLAEYLELSVGGTLTVGGVGSTSARYGVQSDNVLSMDVVTGTGQQITCSAGTSADLFNAVRAGLGQVGVITRATLKLVAAPRQVRRILLFYPDLSTMLKDARLLSGSVGERFDAVQGAILASPAGGWVFRLDVSKFLTGGRSDDDALLAGLSDDPARRESSSITYVAYLNRLAPLEAALRTNGQWDHPHPWLTTFVGDSTIESVASDELARLDPADDLGELGQIVLSPIRSDAITSPLLRTPSGSLCFTFNLIRVPATADISNADRLVEANRAIYERVRNAGGTLYPVSAFPMSSNDWRQHFGPTFDILADAKRKFDPQHVLTPGYEVF